MLPAVSSRPSRPLPVRLLARVLLSRAWQTACSGGLKMGQIQAIFIRWASPAAALDPGQNGSNVWSVLSAAPPELTSAASGYTPNVSRAKVLAGRVIVQSRTAPGARVPDSRATAPVTGVSTEGRFPELNSLSSARLVSLKLDDQSWTVRPDAAVRVVLLTVPCTVTGCPGLATCGFTAVIPTVTCGAAAAAVPGALPRAAAPAAAAAGPAPASAGPAATSAINAHASTQRRASPGHAGLAGLWSRCVRH